MVKDNPSALYLFDQELGQRVFTADAEDKINRRKAVYFSMPSFLKFKQNKIYEDLRCRLSSV